MATGDDPATTDEDPATTGDGQATTDEGSADGASTGSEPAEASPPEADEFIPADAVEPGSDKGPNRTEDGT